MGNNMIKIPKDWERKTLNEIGDFSKGNGISGEQLKSTGVPCVCYGDLYTKYDIKFCIPQNFTDKNTAKESAAISKGTLLFTATGETAEDIGKCVCYYGEETIYVGGDIFILQTKDIDPLFVAYQQNLFPFTKQKARLSQGHSVVHIRLENIKKISVVYPKELLEQQKIAKILAKWDEAIVLQESLIEKLELQKKALMQKLLKPKKDWTTIKIADIGTTFNGLNGKTKEDFGYGKYYIPYMNVYTNSIINENFFERVRIEKHENQAKVIYGDVLFTISSETPNEVGVSSVYMGHETELYLNSFCFGFRINDFKKLLPEFAAYYFRSTQFKKILNKLAQGVTRFNLGKENLLKENIIIPKIQEQTSISKNLMAVDNVFKLHSQKLALLKLQRKALMQLLLTGKIRVRT
jgi:type I restriction enzyme S subunit